MLSGRYLIFVSVSTLLSVLIMVVSSTEYISWSVWAQNLTPGMSLIAVKIFGNAFFANLILCSISGIIAFSFFQNGQKLKSILFYLAGLLALLATSHFLATQNIKEFHLVIVLFLLALQVPVYRQLFNVSEQYSRNTASNRQLLKQVFIWMSIVLVYGMASFYFYFEHPQQLLPLNFEKYGIQSQLYPFLLHFSVLGNFALLTIALIFLSKKLSSYFRTDFLKTALETFLFLLFISLILQGILSRLYYEIEITESRYILQLLPLYLPVIFLPLVLSVLLGVKEEVTDSKLSIPLLAMYVIGSLPLKLLYRILPEKSRTKTVWNIGLVFLSLCYFGFTIFIFKGLLFDPWFTVLSPIKGFVFALSIWIGATLLLVSALKSELLKFNIPTGLQFIGIAVVLISCVFIPRNFHKNPGLKGLLTHYAESVKISLDGLKTFYPESINSSVLKSGQNARVNTTYSISPTPLPFSKTGEEVLNDSVSYIYIMADAMRGDFFEGRFTDYENLYPFMNNWMAEEAVWFKNAYSQSNGSYIGIPALFGSHANRSILKPSSKEENRFFRMLEKDGVKDIYSIEGNSLDNLFPDDIEVTSIGKVPEDFDAFDRNVTAMELLDKLKIAFETREPSDPFFGFLLLMDTHNDYAPKEGFPDYGNRPVDLYAHNIHYVDYFMSELVAWLKEIGEYDNTIIILTSDHGEEFKEHESTLHGHNFFEEVLRVPIIMKLPNISPKEIETPVLNSDIFPTIATLRGYDVSSHYGFPHLGIDQSEFVLAGEITNTTDRDMLLISSQNTKHALLRDGRYKLIYWPRFESYVFYDLEEDPMEMDNRIQENAELAKEMHEKMLELITLTSGETYANTWPFE